MSLAKTAEYKFGFGRDKLQIRKTLEELLIDFIKSQRWIITALIIIIIIAVGSYFAYGKIHNPVEKAVTEMIKNKVGLDVDSILPDDKKEIALE